jgi:hypothetical protein
MDSVRHGVLHRLHGTGRNGKLYPGLWSECEQLDLPMERDYMFIPEDFDVPTRLEADGFVLEPLGPQHNDGDYAAWSSSKEHIHATPGWEQSSWPDGRDRDANRSDLERHANDFRNRVGFTYTVLDRVHRDVIGCVYIYPVPDSEVDARVESWVRADRAELDAELWRAVSDWIVADWPFATVDYAVRT